jgi:pantoate--beta-alanine ligase
MELFATKAAVRTWSRQARAGGRRVGLVPTMGYLHDGHRALIREARRTCDLVVVSIFVNPTQFGPNEDLSRYPRDLDRDLAICRAEGVDAVFHPPVAEIYPHQPLTEVSVGVLADGLCGASRPGHFTGVATVVTKLLNIVQPDRAFFGRKDGQQLAIIQRMVADLDSESEIVPVDTVREPDGLALSSRNVYLNPQERQAALVLSQSLRLARAMVEAGERDARLIRQRMLDLIAAEPLARVDYVEVVDRERLQPLDRLEAPAMAAVAVFIGATRLIDNTLL